MQRNGHAAERTSKGTRRSVPLMLAGVREKQTNQGNVLAPGDQSRRLGVLVHVPDDQDHARTQGGEAPVIALER
jgi:hypothetical protein